MTGNLKSRSLRFYLLVGILLPVFVLISINTASVYSQALTAINTAYDRTLLASTKSIGEQLDVTGYDEQASLGVTLPYAALEAFEADNQSRMFYRVSSLSGKLVSGFAQLPFWRGAIADKPPYAALVDFYDDTFDGDAVRVAVLLQPVASFNGRAMAVIQVAETLQLREALARKVLLDTLWRQALLLLVIALVVVLVVQWATRPVRSLSLQLQARTASNLNPIGAQNAPSELLPLIDATNAVMARLQGLLNHQKRFVRDAAHQLRTPLAVLKVQVQSAQRGDIQAADALADISKTVERAAQVANQMLSLAKVEQLRQQVDAKVLDLAAVVRAVSLDLSALIADKNIDFSIETTAAPITAHDWMLAELSRNLLHNAIKNTPDSGRLAVCVTADSTQASLSFHDSGPGISDELAARLFQPFSAGNVERGSGLGLTICREIVLALSGTISLNNQYKNGITVGLIATVNLPLADHVQTAS